MSQNDGIKPRVKKFKRKQAPTSKYKGKREGFEKQIEIAALAVTTPKDASEVSTREMNPLRERVESLVLERCFEHPNLSVHQFICDQKGYTLGQYQKFIAVMPSEEWEKKKQEFHRTLTLRLLDKHVDLIDKMNKDFQTSGKIGLAKGLELLSKGSIYWDKKLRAWGKRDLYPREYKDVMDGIRLSQQVYRIAVGLPAGNDSEGVKDILEQIRDNQKAPVQNIQNNVQVNIDGTEMKKPDDLISKLTYEDIKVLINAKREMLRLESGEGQKAS